MDRDRVSFTDLMCFIGLKKVLSGLFIGVMALTIPMAVFANGLRENTSWQFESTVERAHKAAIIDLILRQNAGTYNTTFNSTTNTTYSISGDYIDCNMTSQSSGNQGSVAQDVPIASPDIGISPSTSASATGNSGTGTVNEGGDTSNTGLTSQSGDTGSVSNTSTAGGTNSVSTTQSNDSSSQTSSANGNAFDSVVSGISGTGGGASVALNSTQSLSDSQVSSSIANSAACDFNTVSGSIGPINTGGDE